MKYLGLSLTKYRSGLSMEHYRNLTNKLQELNKWRQSPCRTERLSVVETGLLNVIESQHNPTKVSTSYLVDVDN